MLHPKIKASIESCINHDQLRSCLNFIDFPYLSESDVQLINKLIKIQSLKILSNAEAKLEESKQLLSKAKLLLK